MFFKITFPNNLNNMVADSECWSDFDSTSKSFGTSDTISDSNRDLLDNSGVEEYLVGFSVCGWTG